jgi:hypothetical protein
MTRFPVTVYKNEPATTPLAEWHEIWTARNPATGEWILCERHGWWDDAIKQPHFNVPILSEPFKTEPEADAAMDARINALDSEGWIHKYTVAFDPLTGGGKGVRI